MAIDKHRVNEALERLSDAHHSALTESAACEIAEALGVPKERIHCRPLRSNAGPDNPKGLTMYPGNEGMMGISGLALAEMLCAALNVSYEGKLGRGSQVRACVEALWKHFRLSEEGVRKPHRRRINMPCPDCGREDSQRPGTWWTPCPSNDCPSHEKIAFFPERR